VPEGAAAAGIPGRTTRTSPQGPPLVNRSRRGHLPDRGLACSGIESWPPPGPGVGRLVSLSGSRVII
jgi:hypothetical protein